MLVGIDGALLCLVVDRTEQGIPVEIPPVNDRRLLIFVMDQQIDQHRVLELQSQGDVGGEIGQEVINLGIVVLLAHDAGHQTLGVQMVTHQLEQFTHHLTEFDACSRLQPQPDRLERVVEVFGIAEVEQVAVLAVGVGDQRLADPFIIGAGKTVE